MNILKIEHRVEILLKASPSPQNGLEKEILLTLLAKAGKSYHNNAAEIESENLLLNLFFLLNQAPIHLTFRHIIWLKYSYLFCMNATSTKYLLIEPHRGLFYE